MIAVISIIYLVVGFALGVFELKRYSKKKFITNGDVVFVPLFFMFAWPAIGFCFVVEKCSDLAKNRISKIVDKMNEGK